MYDIILFLFLEMQKLNIEEKVDIQESIKEEGEVEESNQVVVSETTSEPSPAAAAAEEEAVSEVKTSNNNGEEKPAAETQWRGFFRKLRKGSTMSFHHNIPSLTSIKKISRKKSRNSEQHQNIIPTVLNNPDLDTQLSHCFESSWKNFSLADIKLATNNFSPGILSSLCFQYFCSNFSQNDILIRQEKTLFNESEQNLKYPLKKNEKKE